MEDIFLSFTSRGHINANWIDDFAGHIKKVYQQQYKSEISVWYYTGDHYGLGDDYRKEIEKILNHCLVFLPVIDLKYFESEQTFKEFDDYSKRSTLPYLDNHYIKVLTQRNVDAKRAVASTIVNVSLYDNTGDIFDFGSDGFLNAVAQIADAVYKLKNAYLEKRIQYEFEKTLTELKEELTTYSNNINIYAPLGQGQFINEQRENLLRELSRLLSKEDSLNQHTFTFFPDELQVMLEKRKLELNEILLDEKWFPLIRHIVQMCKVVIVPLQFTEVTEVRGFTDEIDKQLRLIKEVARERKDDQQVYFLLHVPPEITKVSFYKNAYDNLTLRSSRNISFTDTNESVTQFLEKVFENIKAAFGIKRVVPTRKKIYMLDNQAKNKNISTLVSLITQNGFTVIPFSEDTDLQSVNRLHQENLNTCNGVLIYKKPSNLDEDKERLKRQQLDIYKTLQMLQREEAGKAIYIDPDDADKEDPTYGYYGYQVILRTPEDVQSFLKEVHPN